MRTRDRILRVISELNLDPRVAHVLSKNGKLVPKSQPSDNKQDKEKQEENTPLEDAPLLGASSSPAVDAEQSEKPVEEKPKKKVPPQFKKKKSTDE